MALICQGGEYQFNGNVLNAAGNYTETFLSSGGCDSIVHLILQVQPDYTFTIDTAVLAGTVYTFPSGNTTSLAGTYVDTLKNTGSCDSIFSVNLSIISSIAGVTPAIDFSLFPNPADNVITVKTEGHFTGSTLTITDITGKELVSIVLPASTYKLETSAFNNGTYFVTLRDPDGHSIAKKLIIEK
jgi:hypothetical protein